MNTVLRRGIAAASLVAGLPIINAMGAPVTVDFADTTLDAGSAYTGTLGTEGWASGGFQFNNSVTDWGGGYTSWSGWAYSNKTDTTTAGYLNDTSAIAGGGYSVDGPVAGDVYAIGYGTYRGELTIALPPQTVGAPASMQVTNTTYAYLSMLNGDAFAKKFGGAAGTDPDWFVLTIYGLDHAGAITGEVEVDLANYIGSTDVLVDSWTHVDLSPLGDAVTALTFSLRSSDVGTFGMNTPGYFAMDNLVVDLKPQIIADASTHSDGRWKHAWIGWYLDETAPWVYHAQLGWLYWSGGESGAWLYSSDAGSWFWTNLASFPSLYSLSSDSWLYLYTGSSHGALQYYDFASRSWVTAEHL